MPMQPSEYPNESSICFSSTIQLKKTPGPDNPMFLPTDNWFDWVMAKIYYKCTCADAQVRTYVFLYLSLTYMYNHIFALYTYVAFLYCTVIVTYICILFWQNV